MNDLNEKEDRYWTVEEVRPYIMKYLQEKFPDSIIMREFDDIDIMIFGPNLPVEIQRSYLHNGRNVRISGFEDNTRRQIDINVRTCGICWFFMDQKFLDYLNTNSNRLISLDMRWLYQYFKEGKVKIFSMTYGSHILKELNDEDLNILTKFSISNIDMDRSRYNIAYKVLKGYSFTTDEINNWYNDFEKNGEKHGKTCRRHFGHYLKNINYDKSKKLRDILYALHNLRYVKEMLLCEMDDEHSTNIASILGIVNGISKNQRNRRILCSDTYNILEFFSEYFEKKELWDYWRTHSVDYRTFLKTVRGEYPNYLKDYKNQKNIEDAWG